MLTLEDCIAFSELTPEEIDAIAEHDHLPEIVAAELGWLLVHTGAGCRCIAAMIGDDIAAAQLHGEPAHAARLKLVLRHFIADHQRRMNEAGGGTITRRT
jgi:hypothetical protein